MATSCHACVAARRYSKASDTARSRRTRHPPSQAARPPTGHTHTHTEGDARAVQCRTAEQLVSLCAGGQKARGTPSQTFGSKWATKVKRQVGQVARTDGRTRRRHPCASKGPPAPSVASGRYPRVASRKACDTITSAAGGPCVATGLAAGRTWGSGVRGWQRSAWAVCEAGQQQSGVASALHCSARTELARQRGGSLARWWTGRAGGWLGSRPSGHQLPRSLGGYRGAAQCSSSSASGRRRRTGGRSATLATAQPERGRALTPSSPESKTTAAYTTYRVRVHARAQ